MGFAIMEIMYKLIYKTFQIPKYSKNTREFKNLVHKHTHIYELKNKTQKVLIEFSLEGCKE